MADISGLPPGVSSMERTAAIVQTEREEAVLAQAVLVDDNQDNLKSETESEALPGALLKKQENLKERIAVTRKEEAKEAGEVIPIEEVKAKSEEFSSSHSEHKASDLVSLQQNLKPTDKKEQILQKVRNLYKDPTLIKEALEFLATTTIGALKAQVQEALRDFQVENKLPLTAGENIAEVVKETAKGGVVSASEARQTYVDFISSPEQDAVNKYFDLKAKYGQGKEFKSFMNATLSMLGAALHADSSSKRPSMERAELQRNISEIKIFQALIGVENFFEGRV